MEDNLSIKSSDSITTSGEYEIVPEDLKLSQMSVAKDEGQPLSSETPKNTPISPILNIASNGDISDLEKNLTEVIKELDVNDKEEPSSSSTLQKSNLCLGELTTVSSKLDLPVAVAKSPCSLTTPDPSKVGQSVFYDCLDASPVVELNTQAAVKAHKNDTEEEEISDIDQECTKFSAVTYLGAVSINAPKSEAEIRRKMAEMNAVSSNENPGIEVSISVPNSPEGLVVLYDSKNNVVATYEIQRILFFTPGPIETPDQACFAFTWSHGTTAESQVFQCHIFRCQIPEAITRVNTCFQKAFNPTQSMTCSVASTCATDNNGMMASITSDLTGHPLSQAMYEFNVSLEIKEKVSKNTYSAVSRDKNVFKLRCNVDKEVCIIVKQVPSGNLPPLLIERCFGVLLSAGKLIRQADMQLLDMAHMGYMKLESTTNSLNPALAPYQVRAEWNVNDKAFEELNSESPKKYVTVAVDLVIKGILEPVRFVIETMVQIASQNESRLMDNLLLSKRPLLQKFYLQLKDNAGSWEVQSIDPSEEIIETSQGTTFKAFTKNLSKIVRSQSVLSFDLEDWSPTEGECSDGDEPLLSGTGEVSKECSTDCLEEWWAVLQEWDSIQKRPKGLSPLIHSGGIPEALRCKIWQKLANTEHRSDLMERYRILITKETSCEDIIQRDLNRTFPAHKFFKDTGGLGQDSLYKVSKAYAVHDSEVGYCQGLSFIAASLLLHMPEEEAFAVLVSLMYDYKLRELYKSGFEALYMRLYQLHRLLRDQIPELAEHFEQTKIEVHMFASQWFLTLFTARFPLCFVFHVLDLFLLNGMPVLFQVSMTLLYICKKDLLELDFEGILKYIRVTLPKKCRSESQTRKLMKMVCEWKIKKLKKYEDEYIQKKEETEREQAAMKYYEERFDEERKLLQTEIVLLQNRLQEAEKTDKKSKNIINDYKHIIQRQEQQITKLNEMLEDVTKVVGNCTKCSSNMPQHSPLHKPNGVDSELETTISHPLDPLHDAQQRIRELELELAKTKLDKVEAECRNQDLNHQLTTITEMHQKHSGVSWQPWLTKTLSSIQEKVNTTKRDIPTFQSHVSFDTFTTPAADKDSQEVMSPQTRHKFLQKNNLNRHSFDTSRLPTNTKEPPNLKEN